MDLNTSPQPRFVDYLRPIMARWWLVLIAVVVATGGVYAYYAHKPNVYTASTEVYVTDPGDPVSGVAAAPATDRNVADTASLFDSRASAEVVARNIHYQGTPDQLLGQVAIATKQGEDFITLTANNGDAAQAAAIANGFAQQFVVSLRDTYLARIDNAIRSLDAQLSHATGPASQLTRAGLITERNQLALDRQVPQTIAKQVNAAAAPASPSSPKPLRNAIFALLLSLLGAIALCYGIERFDRRLKTPEDIESSFGLPLFAVLPHTSDPTPMLDGGAVLGPDFREPFRSMRTNIELASVDAPPSTIVVTSAMPGEGKSTVVRNLALALCESGKHVVVVDLDLRNPSLRKLLRIPSGPGFTDVLRGGTSLDDAIVEVPTNVATIEDFVTFGSLSSHERHNGNGNGNGNGRSATRLAFVRSGPRPANPPAALSSERTLGLLNELRDRFDVVLIDSAPVLAVSDTVPLLRYADATLFVGRFGVTSRDTVKRLRDFLSRVPDASVLGVIANELPRLEASSYGWGVYGYGYGQTGEEGDGPDSGRRGLRLGGAGKPKQPA